MMIKKLVCWAPLAYAPCESCGREVAYNLAVGIRHHVDPVAAYTCATPFPGKVSDEPTSDR